MKLSNLEFKCVCCNRSGYAADMEQILKYEKLCAECRITRDTGLEKEVKQEVKKPEHKRQIPRYAKEKNEFSELKRVKVKKKTVSAKSRQKRIEQSRNSRNNKYASYYKFDDFDE